MWISQNLLHFDKLVGFVDEVSTSIQSAQKLISNKAAPEAERLKASIGAEPLLKRQLHYRDYTILCVSKPRKSVQTWLEAVKDAPDTYLTIMIANVPRQLTQFEARLKKVRPC